MKLLLKFLLSVHSVGLILLQKVKNIIQTPAPIFLIPLEF